MLNTLIFDLDLTLLDSLSATVKGANLLADRFNLPEVTEAKILEGLALPTKEFWINAFGEFKDEWQDFLERKVLPEINRNIKLYPEGEDILKSAKRKGYLLAVASNRAKPWHDLADLNLAKYFDTVVGSLDVLRPKPAPDMLLTIVAQLGVDLQSVIYVGDAEADMNCAKAADIIAIGLTQGGSTPEKLFNAGATYVRPTLASSRDLLGC
ncbi:MAG: HAD family hydrolase [Deltaproteobacteria bacterium]|jgi:HAD superfamily hydrolase (TIGR01509 family)|nr:HAD family hydrolase [Deltaproteobacteria bacterium]